MRKQWNSISELNGFTVATGVRWGKYVKKKAGKQAIFVDTENFIFLKYMEV